MKAIGIILAGGNNHKLGALSEKRAVGAMPVAGSYRSIDFALSSMSNSRIQKVGVFTQYNAGSLNEHLSSSKWWDFGRKQGGLYVFTPTITADNGFWYRGTADAIYQNLSFLKNSHEPYVIIASADCVYKIDFNKLLEYHIDKKADITVVCKDMPEGTNLERFGTIKMNEESRIEEFEEKPLMAKSNTISCGIYVIRRRPLRFCTGYLDSLQRYEAHLWIQNKRLLEEYCNCRRLFPDKYGFPETGNQELFL